MPLPGEDEMFNTKGKMLQDIMVSLGGRIAEEIIFDDVTTGASQDIKQATKIARAMVTRYGMSEQMGMIDYGDDDEVFIGRDFGHTKGYGEEVASMIDREVKRIIDDCYKEDVYKRQDPSSGRLLLIPATAAEAGIMKRGRNGNWKIRSGIWYPCLLYTSWMTEPSRV